MNAIAIQRCRMKIFSARILINNVSSSPLMTLHGEEHPSRWCSAVFSVPSILPVRPAPRSHRSKPIWHPLRIFSAGDGEYLHKGVYVPAQRVSLNGWVATPCPPGACRVPLLLESSLSPPKGITPRATIAIAQPWPTNQPPHVALLPCRFASVYCRAHRYLAWRSAHTPCRLQWDLSISRDEGNQRLRERFEFDDHISRQREKNISCIHGLCITITRLSKHAINIGFSHPNVGNQLQHSLSAVDRVDRGYLGPSSHL